MDVHNAYEPLDTKNPQKTKEWNSISGLTIQSQQYLLTANENISSIRRGKKGKHSQILTYFRGFARTRWPKVTKLVSWLDMKQAKYDKLHMYLPNIRL